MKTLLKITFAAALFVGALSLVPSAEAGVRIGFSVSTPRYGFAVGHSPAYYYSSYRAPYYRTTVAYSPRPRYYGGTTVVATGRRGSGAYYTSRGNFGSYYVGPRRTYAAGTNGYRVYGRRGSVRVW